MAYSGEARKTRQPRNREVGGPTKGREGTQFAAVEHAQQGTDVLEDQKAKKRSVSPQEVAQLVIDSIMRGSVDEFIEQIARQSRIRSSLGNKYSLRNWLLILMQHRDASIVKGYRQWEKMGFQVRKGEKALWVIAPVIKDVLNEATGEYEKRIVGFRDVKVFDISQTEPVTDKAKQFVDTLNNFLADNLAEADVVPDGAMNAIMKMVSDAGARVEYVPQDQDSTLRGGARGYYTPQSNKITVADHYSEADRIRIIAHEIGHHYDKWLAENPGEYQTSEGRRNAEIFAEIFGATVATRLGVKVMPEQGCGGFNVATYVANWSGNVTSGTMTDVVAKMLLEQAERVDSVLKNIEVPMIGAPTLQLPEASE